MAALTEMVDFDLLEQISNLIWAHTGNTELAESLATFRIMKTLWDKLSDEKDIEALRNQTILSITKYVKDHPKASRDELSKEIGRQIAEFAKQVEKM